MRVTGFTIDQTTQYISDQFEITLADDDAFVNRANFDIATIRHGLLDATGSPQLVDHIVAGKIDEFELHEEPDGLTTVIRGRDAASFAVDTTLYITYLAGGRDWRLDRPAPVLPPGLQPIPGVTLPIVLPGTWRASTICEDLCRRVGLNCAYQADDYLLREDVVVAGPVIQTIQQLVAPFSQFEPSRVDIWTDGTTMYIRKRPGLDGGTAGAPVANQFNAQDLRVSNLMIRARFQDGIRTVKLSGAAFGNNQTLTYTTDTTESDDSIDPRDGVTVMSRQVRTKTTRFPDNAILHTLEEQYALSPAVAGLYLVGETETTSNWDGLQFDEAGRIVNSPKRRSEVTTIRGRQRDGSMGPTGRTTVTYTYDASGFLKSQDTVQEGFNTKTGQYVNSKRELKVYETDGVNQFEVKTTQFAADSKQGWKPTDIRKTTGGGAPPGGPNRAPSTNANALAPIFLNRIIDNVAGAKDFTYSNPNLLFPSLQIIFQEAKDSSFALEFEVNLTVAGVPWLRRGQMMQILNFLRVDGVTPILLKPMLIFETKTEYREATGESGSVYDTHIKAVWWSKS